MNYIYLHGFASGKHSYKGTYLKQCFAEAGQTLHTPDLNGDNFERMTISSQLAIVRKWVDNCEGEMTIIGSSLGGYLAALFAEAEPRVSQIVMMCPAFRFATRYTKRMPPALLNRWRQEGFLEIYHFGYQEKKRLHVDVLTDAAQYDNRDLQRQLPALLIHGINDEVVPYELSVNYMKNNKLSQIVLLNSDHGMSDVVEEIWRQTRLFLEL